MTWLRAAAFALMCMAGLPAMSQDLGVIRSEILVLDPDRLFSETALGRRMLDEHQAAREELAARNRQLEAELEAEEQELTELRADMSAADFRELADAFDDKVQKIREDSNRRALDLERDRKQLPSEFLRTVEPVLTKVMREAGGRVVLNKRTVVFHAEAIDITGLAVAWIDRDIGDGLTGDEPRSEDQAEQ